MTALGTGKRAPQLALPDLKGKTISLGEELQRGPVVLVFLKISCPICQYALPFLERIHRAFPKAAIYGVSQNSARDTERFCREFGVTFPMLLDDPKTYAVSNAYGITNVPTVFLVAIDGKIEVSSVGWAKNDVEEIARRLGDVQNAPRLQLFQPGEQVSDFRSG